MSVSTPKTAVEENSLKKKMSQFSILIKHTFFLRCYNTLIFFCIDKAFMVREKGSYTATLNS